VNDDPFWSCGEADLTEDEEVDEMLPTLESLIGRSRTIMAEMDFVENEPEMEIHTVCACELLYTGLKLTDIMQKRYEDMHTCVYPHWYFEHKRYNGERVITVEVVVPPDNDFGLMMSVRGLMQSVDCECRTSLLR
jgi:hypothetical protein